MGMCAKEKKKHCSETPDRCFAAVFLDHKGRKQYETGKRSNDFGGINQLKCLIVVESDSLESLLHTDVTCWVSNLRHARIGISIKSACVIERNGYTTS